MAGATLRQVAVRAGVSHQTVSNVINGVTVRPETLDRVHAAMRELNYQPNFAARALRAAKSLAVTVAFFEHHSDEVSDPYRNLVQAAVTHEATRLGYSLLNTFVSRSGPSTLTTLHQQHQQRRTDGTVLVGLLDDPALFEQLRSSGMPVVLFDYSGPPSGFPTITAQYAEGMQMLVNLVVQQGKRDLALVIAGDDGTTRIERERSFLAATRAHGVRGTISRGDWSYASGERAFRELWQGPTRPDAVLAANDRMAVGCLATAREMDVRVPEDVLITGFDDFEFSRYTVPGLTTIQVPYELMAREALNQLIDALKRGGTEEPTVRRFPVKLVRRQSA